MAFYMDLYKGVICQSGVWSKGKVKTKLTGRFDFSRTTIGDTRYNLGVYALCFAAHNHVEYGSDGHCTVNVDTESRWSVSSKLVRGGGIWCEVLCAEME